MQNVQDVAVGWSHSCVGALIAIPSVWNFPPRRPLDVRNMSGLRWPNAVNFAKAQPSSNELRDWLRSYKEEDHGA